MTKNIAQYGHFNKIKLSQDELDSFREDIDENYELSLKNEVQKIFHNAGIEISLDEIFAD
jgi:hypothetical protein